MHDQSSRPNRISPWILASLLALMPVTPVNAGGATLYDEGSPDNGHAIAGRFALAGDACTLLHNPAGLPRLEGTQTLIGVQPLFVDLEFSPGGDTEAFLGRDDGGQAGGLSPLGGVCHARNIGSNENLKFGFGLGALAGSAIKFDDDWVGRYYLTELELNVVAAAASAGYRVGDRFSFGGALLLASGEFIQKAAINNVLDAIPDGELEIDDTAFSLGGRVGGLFEVSDRTRFGLTYTTELEFEFEDVLTVSDIGPGLKAAAGFAGLAGSELDITLTLPQSVFFSWYQEVTDRLALMGNLGWEDYSEFGFIDVAIVNSTVTNSTADLKLDDTHHVALGARLKVGERSVFTTGYAYDSSTASVGERSPVLPLDRQARVSFGLERTRDSGNIWTVWMTYVDLGNARFDVNRGPLAGRLQGSFDSNALLTAGFTWQWR